jgi:type VI secretion system protein VasG
MLLADPRALLDKLNATTKRALERGAGACVTSRHYEVSPEHVLLALLDDAESDVVVVLEHLRVEAGALRAALQRALGDQRSGNAGRPVFSPLLLEWLQDAWLYASTELNAQRLRSGALLVRLAQSPSRYVPGDLPVIPELPKDELRKNLVALAGDSAEAAEAASVPQMVTPGGAPTPGPGAPGGESALARFCTNLTARAKNGELDPVFGRESEVRQVVDILCRRRKNNPIIVGEPGVGKTALVEGLALRIAAGDVPDQLRDVQVMVLDLGSLQAGAGVRGEFENRLKGVISEVKASAKPIVLFIDEAHTLIGAGGAQGGGDAANLLKPALARGELRTIAATTWAEFKRYFEKDAALERRFQPVKVDEPSIEQAIVMLRGLAEKFEAAHGVRIRDDAVRASVVLSSRYISGRQLPDKAVDLLDTAAARVKVMRASKPGALEDLHAREAAVGRALAALERDHASGLSIDEAMKDELQAEHAAVDAQKSAIAARHAEQLALVREIDALRKAPDAPAATEAGTAPPSADAIADRVTELRERLVALGAIPSGDVLVHADVDEAIIASIVSDWTGIPVGRMVQDDVKAILELEPRLRARVRGQDGALAVIGRELRAARSGLKAPGAPLGVFLLVGPSGVGKTETALALADQLFGGERFLITINMSEFQERHTVSRLIGSPPGYVGFGEGGKLTEAVRQRPYSVVLLDEVEKADREVMNLFYAVFDKGILNDGEGRSIDFSNTVIVMTSNLATDLLTRAADPQAATPPFEDLVSLVKPTLSEWFKPALLARMTVVPYVPIRADALDGIVRTKLDAVVKRARAAHKVSLVVDDAVVKAIAERCREVESGARNVDHILRGSVLPLVSNEILRGMSEGQAPAVIRLGVGPGGELACAAEGV